MRLAITIALLLALAACGKTAEQKQREEAATLTSMGEKYVREKVLEPAQAQFRNQFIGKGGAPCGEVNAKDAFGGYIGFQRYISVARDLTLLAQDVAPAEFEAQWQQLCR
ncbi:hypothetical protein SAMN05216319_0426 [Duganella sp. CF402]|uniref:hypothetical protein n=1 Tax=unclassified Duganella TaxID=2636909 RepID=UPI0008C4457D|nr:MULTISPECIES: hypothetical protein [unclassified Duganella]RZT11097.1 hypothetical protein EV582_3200 [Duganella sp. BK701]SEK81639.1 hypothetical protein SAMN05216319_0426 [Duganella sp. CF402]